MHPSAINSLSEKPTLEVAKTVAVVVAVEVANTVL